MTELLPDSLSVQTGALVIGWNDGREDRYPLQVLRDCCPCATCKIARSEKQEPDSNLLPVLSPAEVGPLKLAKMEPVGNYAYSIDFSDGHNSGIYPVELLRRLGDELRRIEAEKAKS